MSHLPSLHWAVTATRGRCPQNHNLKKEGEDVLLEEGEGTQHGHTGGRGRDNSRALGTTQIMEGYWKGH